MSFAFDWNEPTSVPNSYTGSSLALVKPGTGWPVPFLQLSNPDASAPSKAALLNAYRVYAVIKLCNVTRLGYLVTYVNDIELGRAREKITLIEAPYISENTGSLSDVNRN